MPLVPPPRPSASQAADIPPTSVLTANQPEWTVGDLAGALKRTLEGEWCHLSCMTSSNVLTVLNYSNMEPIIA